MASKPNDYLLQTRYLVLGGALYPVPRSFLLIMLSCNGGNSVIFVETINFVRLLIVLNPKRLD